MKEQVGQEVELNWTGRRVNRKSRKYVGRKQDEEKKKQARKNGPHVIQPLAHLQSFV